MTKKKLQAVLFCGRWQSSRSAPRPPPASAATATKSRSHQPSTSRAPRRKPRAPAEHRDTIRTKPTRKRPSHHSLVANQINTTYQRPRQHDGTRPAGRAAAGWVGSVGAPGCRAAATSRTPAAAKRRPLVGRRPDRLGDAARLWPAEAVRRCGRSYVLFRLTARDNLSIQDGIREC